MIMNPYLMSYHPYKFFFFLGWGEGGVLMLLVWTLYLVFTPISTFLCLNEKYHSQKNGGGDELECTLNLLFETCGSLPLY